MFLAAKSLGDHDLLMPHLSGGERTDAENMGGYAYWVVGERTCPRFATTWKQPDVMPLRNGYTSVAHPDDGGSPTSNEKLQATKATKGKCECLSLRDRSQSIRADSNSKTFWKEQDDGAAERSAAARA